jgi:hypothetical protein
MAPPADPLVVPDVPSAGEDAAQNAILATATTYYLSLHTGDPGTTGANEGSEGRQAITFGASSGGSQASNSAQTWPSAVGGGYSYFGVWTASSGGTYKRGGWLTPTIYPLAGTEIVFASGAVAFAAS